MKDTVFYSKKTLNVKGKLVDLSDPIVMGIINVTPDSFYAGSRVTGMQDIVIRAGKLLEEGATILDLGGYSTRPGAEDITESEELKRIIPALEIILKNFPDAIVSIDTFRTQVAKQALNTGASIINDISGGTLNENMSNLIAEYKVPYILMHLKGTPQTMVQENKYESLIDEVIEYFVEKIALLRKKGIKDIIIDPGFGFAKNINQNYELLKKLSIFQMFELPILVGISRKSMIYRKLNISPEESLNGSVVLNTIALTKGANILRVHDVKESVEAIQLLRNL